MQITIDTNTELSDTDRKVLEILLGKESARKVVEEPAKASPAPAKRPAPAKKAPEPVVEESPDEDEDLLGEDEPTVTQEMLVELVSSLVSKGKGKAIKAILTDAGAGKVRELDEDKYAEVYTALQAL